MKTYFVYIIQNLLEPVKAYVGMTNGHKKYYMGSDETLYEDIKKLGKINFSKIILGTFDNWEECHYWEGFYIRTLKTHISNGGYNKSKNGGNYFEHKSGLSLSKEHRKKISDTLKGNVPWNKGKIGLQLCSKETKQKISDSNKGKHHSLETNKKISNALKGKSTWSKGKHLSKEHRNNISEGLKKYYKNEHS